MKISSRNLVAGCLVAAFSTGAFAQTTHNVLLDGFVFIPTDITIELGDTVHWEWVSGNHNVESGIIDAGVGIPDANFRSGEPTPVVGTSYDLLFDQAFLDANPMPGGVYPYYCIIHVVIDMAGTITVNVPEVEPSVPAASTWGLVCMVLVLATVSSILLVRKRRTQLVNA